MKKNLRKKLLAVVLMATMVFSTSGFAFAGENDVDKTVSEATKSVQQTQSGVSTEAQDVEQNEALDQAAEKLGEALPDNNINSQTDKSRAAAEATYVAQIGSDKYETLQEAVDNAKDGDTITVLADVDEKLYIDPGKDVSLTIDFDDNWIMSEDYADLIIIYSGNIKILNALISNDNEIDKYPTCICITDANVTLEDCTAFTAADDSVGYYITGISEVYLNNCSFMDVSSIDDEVSQTNVIGCMTNKNVTLTANNCFIYIYDGTGIYSCGTTNINDSDILVHSKYSDAILSLEGGTVNINDGYYYGNPALFVYDIDSSATITKGEFVSSFEGYSAIDDFETEEGFGANVTIANGSMSSPSESYWKANGSENINVYKNLAAPSSVKAKLSKYNAATFSWSKVSGAAAYKVYYKKSSAKSYTYLTTTNKTYVTKTGLSAGTKYDFRVYPCDTLDNTANIIYCKSSNYKAASVYTLKKLSTPKVSKKSNSSVTVKWTNISGEAGYQISKSTKKSGTSIVSTYKTTSGKSKVIKAKKGKTYYYKVRAFAYDSKGNKVYGPWSSVKSYKLK